MVLKKIDLLKNINFNFHGLNLSNEINNYTKISLFNALKLNIYKKQLNRIFFKFKIKKFHYYMFEYNLGFFLSNEIRKNSESVKLVGYQHGIFSEKLMWLDLLKLSKKKLTILPHEMVIKFPECLEDYKKTFKNKKILLKKNLSKKIDIKISKKKKHKNHYLVLLGLHDANDMIDKLIEIVKLEKKYIFFVKYHPKSKTELNLKNKNIKIIDNINTVLGGIILSQTSTLVYDMICKNLSN